MDITTALRECNEDNPGWIDLVRILLRDMAKAQDVSGLLGAAKLLKEGGYDCIAKIKAASPEKEDKEDGDLRTKGNTMIRLAVDFLSQAGDNDALVQLAHEQGKRSLRLSLRCWASLNGSHRWTDGERTKVLDLADRMKSQVVTHDDVTRIRDAYAALGLREEIALYADALETQGHPVWSRMLRKSLDTEPEEEPVAST